MSSPKEAQDDISTGGQAHGRVRKEKYEAVEEAKWHADKEHIQTLEKVTKEAQTAVDMCKVRCQNQIDGFRWRCEAEIKRAVSDAKMECDIEMAKTIESIQEKHRQSFMRVNRDHQQEIKELKDSFRDPQNRILTNEEIARFLTTDPESRTLFKTLASEELVKYRLKIKSQYQALLREIDAEKGGDAVSHERYNYTAEIPEVKDYSGPHQTPARASKNENAPKNEDVQQEVIDLTTPTKPAEQQTQDDTAFQSRVNEIKDKLTRPNDKIPKYDPCTPMKPKAMLSADERAVRLRHLKAKKYDELVASGVVQDRSAATTVRTSVQKAVLFDRLVLARVTQPIRF